METQLLPLPSPKLRHPWPLLLGFWACVAISMGVVVRRMSELLRPSYGGNPAMAAINTAFSSHAALTMAHIIPAALFVAAAVGVLFSVSDRKWLLQLFFLLGAITGMTAYAMNRYAIGGRAEQSAVLLFNTWFLFSLGRAYWFSIRNGMVKRREWISRTVGVLLGIATTRPVMGILFATSALTHLTPDRFFGLAFWVGFSINVAVTEIWLHSRVRLRIRGGSVAL